MGFLEDNQFSIWSFIDHLFRERLEILRGNVKKVLPRALGNKQLQHSLHGYSWTEIWVSDCICPILFATSENEILLPIMHRTSLAKEVCPFIAAQFLDTTEYFGSQLWAHSRQKAWKLPRKEKVSQVETTQRQRAACYD